jgi:DNA-binding Xre family transcriptional regulator
MYKLRVAEVMAEKKISMRKLQKETGYPIQTIRQLKRAPEGYFPNMKTLLDIARVLGCTLNDLYEEIPDDTA